MSSKKAPILYLPDNEYGFKAAGRWDIQKRPEFGFTIEERDVPDKHWSYRLKTFLTPNTHRLIGYKDWQQSRVYRAEYGMRDESGYFSDLDHIRAYVADIWEQMGLTETRSFRSPPSIRANRRRTAATGSTSRRRIGIPPEPWAHCRVVVLHEVAHILCPSNESHGPMFVRTFADLLSKFVDAKSSLQFLTNCETGRVSHSTRYDYDNPPEPGDETSRNGYKVIHSKRRLRVEVAPMNRGLARFGPGTGFMTGVPANNIVSPYVSGVKLERGARYEPFK